ncbi:hypothetical protein BT96DRAFT_950481 [Gymnopus androsaceus JB14]|uniref:Uncharacterized protein n=1 Tax=Gymnopus androsaceus JB14 TaxID=1447944 RepID=A0A6A4GGD5_9AGAR|nr:hypothetical protein BT96DRAFT_950481 [Gymnopus androsaceus JB14]
MKLWTIVKSQSEISDDQKNRIKALYEGVVRSLRTKVPLLHLKRKVGTNWEYSSNLTSVYLNILHKIATAGTTFKVKNALLTGVGKGSICVEVVKGLFSGVADLLLPLYLSTKTRSRTWKLLLTTFGMDLNFILPFAGIPENGREIDGIDNKSELAHCIMLTNLLRILGAVKGKQASRQFLTCPTQVILPLSPNHACTLTQRFLWKRSSSVGLQKAGVNISVSLGLLLGGLVGTTLMGLTNIIAHKLKSYGIRTFSAKEMAFNILGLMHPLLFSITQDEPIWADLNEITTRIQSSLMKESDLRRAIAHDNATDYKILNGVDAECLIQTVDVLPHANFRFKFPDLETQETLINVTKLCDLIDLEKVMVVTGSGEAGPWGNSRTRWEMEA